MRALVVTIWVFINLVFFGMCGYMYLLWSQYWMYIEKDVQTTANTYDQQIYYYNRGYPMNETIKFLNNTESKTRIKHSTKDNNNVTIIRNSKPRFPNVQGSEFPTDIQKYVCIKDDSTTSCDNKTLQYKERLFKELKRVFLDESNVLKPGQDNYYNVAYKGPKENYMEKTPKEILCELKNVKLSTLTSSEVHTDLKNFIPTTDLFENTRFNSCAIISSAGSFTNSSSGKLIDSYDLVLRFNNAPTKGFAKDVGKKTTVRILNSQVMSKDEFKFLTAPVFRNITILAWDPTNYTASLRDWLEHPEFNLFPNYMEYRKRFPYANVYIINPQTIWNVWNFLQRNSPNRLRRNPPSSGFLGKYFFF
ncbi:beta-galactoside alpha-26-sialyltransferase [Holotrichia oblita]|uniref:Beta-galactoside alpha-26-sialyltransferase n=1 Tax=Holotrichia oblita TaxID=644536 RepID=A0ACB9TC12_HOLOL|nr:beta-galactoside alpha-26-sialyltransferase [Holotrichia oblita]